MQSRLLLVLGLSLVVPVGHARAAFHLWDVTEVYSNADGSVQFIEFFTTTNNQDELFGHDVTSTANTFTIPHDLGTADPEGNPNGGGDNATANRHFLIATPAFEAVPGAPTPDYVLPGPLFFDTGGDTVTLVNADAITFSMGELPLDGVQSLNEDFGGTNRTTATNSPTNFAGESSSIDLSSSEPAVPVLGPLALGLLFGSLAIAGIAARRARSRS